MLLMISVLSASEAREALQGGAEILDIKNPAEGSLGAQVPRVIEEIKEAASGKVKISVAIGDLPNLPGTAALAALGAAALGADYVKAGLYGVHREIDAVNLLAELKEAVRPFGSSVVAAGYADFRRAGTLGPDCLLRAASAAGARACLLDTAVKDGRGLFDFINPRKLALMAGQAHAAGLLFGLAGALREQDLPVARNLGADVVGLRTAACRDNRRSGPLEAALVRRLADSAKFSAKV